MTNRRAKNLDDKAIDGIVQILDGWRGKLTWDLLIEAIAQRTKCTYTRQALHRHERILEAYQLRKEDLSVPGAGKQRVPESLSVPEVAALMERCERLEGENARLKAEKERLEIQFDVWAYNAYLKGADEDYLNRPLPEVNRELTKLPAKPRKAEKR
ncbi:hypothetical protein AQ915_25855 [Burkholderia pseudomallei]|uniref:hypothetical protein n=1 Tax=Burkholderia pseudomallei TaxID=28450 RepID=UPI00050EC9CE|nr:hypothetical protein [Burkholderia pseudomallei]KGC61368.1 hypothetical protein DP56_625 [Burkholderia pseudomallei]ONC42179.1 hypothetical protein AQ915_25855 [Burkholderia pseudomallei]